MPRPSLARSGTTYDNQRVARFRSVFGRQPSLSDLEREERARQLLLLGVPQRHRRPSPRVLARR